MRLRFLILAALLTFFPGMAWSQCGTQAPANKFCGNDTGSQALATYKSIPAGALTPIAGGTVLGNPTGALAVPVATTAPVLGIPGTSTGQVGLAGSGSGTATLRAQTAAGSGVSLLPTAGGTLVGTVTAPLTLDAVTGLLSLPGQSGGVLAGSSPAFTRTPVLGVPGSFQGTLGFAGLTSGTATITAQATAGSPTLTLPNTSGTFAVGASSPLVLNATTGALTCPTCVTSSGGGAITGTAPISVSAAGVVSINAPYVSLTANNGGIVYSGATNLAIFNGTATARLPLLSGASTTPQWGAYTLPASVTSGGIGYFSSTGAESSSGLLTANALLLGGGAGGAPTNVGSLGTTTTVLHGNAAGAPTFGAVVSADLSITTTTCTNQFVTAISAGGVGTCTTDTLASAQHANQGTTTTLLHGNAAGNPSFGQLVFADITSTEVASAAQYLAGTASKLVQSGVIYQAETTTTFGSTTTFDFSTFINTRVTLTANITTQTLSNVIAGKAGHIVFKQSGAGSFTTVWNTIFKFSGGVTPVLTTGSTTAEDVLFYDCTSTSVCYASLNKDMK